MEGNELWVTDDAICYDGQFIDGVNKTTELQPLSDKID